MTFYSVNVALLILLLGDLQGLTTACQRKPLARHRSWPSLHFGVQFPSPLPTSALNYRRHMEGCRLPPPRPVHAASFHPSKHFQSSIRCPLTQKTFSMSCLSYLDRCPLTYSQNILCMYKPHFSPHCVEIIC